jgi:hypothetical protein
MFGSVTCENVGSNILRKAKNMFRHVDLSDQHSVRLHGTTRLQLDRFSCNFILEYFFKALPNTHLSLNSDKYYESFLL